MESKKTVAVVGAGPCGIFISYALSTISDQVDYQVYDKQEQPGGQWLFNPNKIDKYGMTVHSSVYDDLWLNGPKEALQLPIYRFSEELPSFCTRHDMTNYINGFIDHFKLRDKFQCSTLVLNIVYNEEKKKFILTKKNLESGNIQVKDFDYVIISTGHFSIPHDPKLPGQQTFTGEVFHSHFFRYSKLYKGKRILNIGGSYSSEDIALQCHKFGAQKVTIANKSRKFPFKWPCGIDQKPFTQVKNISGSNVQFTDGSSDDFDVIIKCTGYLHDFPFIDQSLRLKTANVLNPPLYQQIVYPENERLFYTGMQNQFYTMSMFYLQSLYIRAVISGQIQLPSFDEKLKWIEQDKIQAQKLKTAEDKILYQSNYIDGLAAAIGQKSLNAADLFLSWAKHKRENIMTYRDKQFKSIYTSQLAPKGNAWANDEDETVIPN